MLGTPPPALHRSSMAPRLACITSIAQDDGLCLSVPPCCDQVVLRILNLDDHVTEIAHGNVVARVGAKLDHDGSGAADALFNCAVYSEPHHLHFSIVAYAE